MALPKNILNLMSSVRSKGYTLLGMVVTGPSVPIGDCSVEQALVLCERAMMAIASTHGRLGVAVGDNNIVIFPTNSERSVTGQPTNVSGSTKKIDELAGLLKDLLQDPRFAMINR